MSATAIIVKKLLATAAVTAIVPKAIREVQPDEKDRPPFIAVNLVGGNGDIGVTLEGGGGYWRHRVRVECSAENGAKAHALGEAVIEALHLTIKSQIITGYNDVDILVAAMDTTEPADGQQLARRIIDFHVTWRRAS